MRTLKTETEETPIYGILALVFGVFSGVMGLVFGIIGLKTYKNETYRKYCKIGIVISVVMLLVSVIIIVGCILVSIYAGEPLPQ